MNKALIITTTSGFLSQFELNNVRLLQKKGYQVHYATNFGVPIYEVKDETLRNMGVVLHHISIEKNPFKIKKNIWALRELIRIIDREEVDVVHCHNPNGGVLGRLAAALSKRKPYVIYTAHGFHFFQGAPLKSWLFYYPVEKFLARFSDVIITINHEDYALAKKKFHAKKTYYLPGIGIDLEKFHVGNAEDIEKKRQELGLHPKDIFLLSVGELSDRKNHVVVIEAMKHLVQNYPQLKYFICGQGEKKQELQQLIRKYHLEDHVKLLGFRTDVAELCQAADVFVFPSKQEGLPVALMEAMACGVPVVCSRIRGNTDLVEDEKCLFMPDKAEQLERCIELKLKRKEKKNVYCKLGEYDLTNVLKKYGEIYAEK